MLTYADVCKHTAVIVGDNTADGVKQMQVRTCFTSTKVRAYGYKSTKPDTCRAACAALDLLAQKYVLTGTKYPT